MQNDWVWMNNSPTLDANDTNDSITKTPPLMAVDPHNSNRLLCYDSDSDVVIEKNNPLVGVSTDARGINVTE